KLSDFGTEGIFSSDGTAVMPRGLNSLTFNFGRGIPRSQVPGLLRNIVLELSLGDGAPPAAHGDSGSPGATEDQHGGTAPARGGAKSGETVGQAAFQVEGEATTLVPEQASREEVQETPLLLAAGAMALAAVRPAPAARTVQAFDPATGRMTERSEAAV